MVWILRSYMSFESLVDGEAVIMELSGYLCSGFCLAVRREAQLQRNRCPRLRKSSKKSVIWKLLQCFATITHHHQ